MKMPFRYAVALASLLLAAGAWAAPPDPPKTRAYIDHAWDTLTRSLDDCSALRKGDTKTHAPLYLPADLPAPPELAAVAKR